MVRRGFDVLTGNTVHAVPDRGGLLRVPQDRFTITYNGLDFDLLAPSRPPRTSGRSSGPARRPLRRRHRANLRE